MSNAAPEIRFYHLTRQTAEQALPALLAKALTTGKKVVVKLPDNDTVEKISHSLWVYDATSFLPHGSAQDGLAEYQPIWLTATDENPNGASILMTAYGATPADMAAYSLCCEILDGHNEESVQTARTRWKTYKEAGYALTYWQQTDSGSWEKK